MLLSANDLTSALCVLNCLNASLQPPLILALLALMAVHHKNTASVIPIYLAASVFWILNHALTTHPLLVMILQSALMLLAKMMLTTWLAIACTTAVLNAGARMVMFVLILLRRILTLMTSPSLLFLDLNVTRLRRVEIALLVLFLVLITRVLMSIWVELYLEIVKWIPQSRSMPMMFKLFVMVLV
jgi:hypothetical protein